ncbi:MAG: coproporphyrinogen dehydrogenase HemZ [Bacillota bacterium]|nr:coproporphyrinogen dehydrogenase HemZ [Bacillota bacterium]
MKISLNNAKYKYEIFQIFNLFYNQEEIEFSDISEFKINIFKNKVIIENNIVKEYGFDNDLTEKENIKKAVYSYLVETFGYGFPYGTLVGIRPSKIASRLLKEGVSGSDIIKYYDKHYLASGEKAKLCIEVAENEKKLLNDGSHKVSIYIGMPFCPTRCIYCSFASNPINKAGNLVQPYLNALTKEIEVIGRIIRERNIEIDCVYFGGGTPTSIDEESFEKIMGVIYDNFVYEKNIREFTVECGRADSINFEKLNIMKKFSTDRISINPQSMNNRTLKMIGRSHTKEDVINIFNMARNLGFKNINMDIIIGLADEGINEIKNTMDEIEKLNPDSITVHGLSIKRGSRLKDSDNQAVRSFSEIYNMYQEAHDRSKKLGMFPYYMYRQKNTMGNMENTGYCIPSKEGIYNMEMIEDSESILAFGADGVSKLVDNKTGRIDRQANVKDVKEYINRIDEMISKKIQLFFKEELQWQNH